MPTSATRLYWIEVKNEKGKPVIWTSVIDTGIGIKREHQEIIFD